MTALRRHWRGAVEVDVAVVRRTPDEPETVRALAYPALVGEPVVGDRTGLSLLTFQPPSVRVISSGSR